MPEIEPNKFENSFINNTLIKDEVNKPVTIFSKSKRVKVFIFVLSFFLLMTGIIVIIRGIFIGNPPLFNNENLVNSFNKILNENKNTELKSFNTDFSGNPLPTFAEKVKTPFLSEQISNKWLLVKNSEKTDVGYLDINLKFIIKYSLPQNAELIYLLEDESLIFASNPQNGFEAKLYIQQPNSLPVVVKSLSLGEYFTSDFYQPDERLIYYNFIDTEAKFHLEAVDIQSKTFKIFTSNFFNKNTSILNVDTLNGNIYFHNDLNCYMLTLSDKSVKDYPCEKIKVNNLDKLYLTNSNNNGIYTQPIRGELYQYSLNSQKEGVRKVILSAKDYEIFENLTLYNNAIYFVNYKFEQSAQNVWKSVPKSIDKLDLKSFVRTTITTNLPPQLILKIIPHISNTVFLIVDNGNNNSKLLKYNGNNEPTDPASYPISYGSFWDGYSFTNDIKVSSLEAKYTLK